LESSFFKRGIAVVRPQYGNILNFYGEVTTIKFLISAFPLQNSSFYNKIASNFPERQKVTRVFIILIYCSLLVFFKVAFGTRK